MVGVLLDLLEPDRIRFKSKVMRDWLLGLALSPLGIIIMLLSFEAYPGVVIDARSVLLFAIGLFFGPIPTVLTATTCLIIRWTQGGVGMLPGMGVIAISATIGLVYRRKFCNTLSSIPFQHLLAASTIIHLSMGVLVTFAMLQNNTPVDTILYKVAWVASAYALGAAFFCLFLSRRIAGRERRRKLEESEAEARKLSSAVEQSPASVVITETDGTINYVNEKFTQLTGYSREEVIGQKPSVLKSGELSESVYAELWETVLSGKAWTGEFHNKRKDGSLFWEIAMIAPIIGPDGEIEKIVALKEDITERKELEAALLKASNRAEAASAAKSTFLSMISHELMTPLNSIIGPSELLLEIGQKEDQELLIAINKGALRLHRIFQDLLTISEGGLTELEGSTVSKVSLREFAHSFEDSHGSILATKEQALAIDVDSGLPDELSMHEEPIRRMIDLLLENAAKHANPGQITLCVAPAEGGVTFHIADEGPGLPEQMLSPCSEVFLQADMSSTRKVDGVGLGLAVCHALAVSMGGSLRISNIDNKGAEFVIFCPVLDSWIDVAASQIVGKIS